MSEARVLPGVSLIVRMAWSSLVTAFSRMTVLFVSVAVLNVALGLGMRWTQTAIVKALIVGHLEIEFRVAIGVGLGAVYILAGVGLMAPVAVVVHRLVLLDEVAGWRRLLARRVLVFAVWTAAVQLVGTLAYFPALFNGAIALKLLALAVLSFFAVRFAFLFPAIAIEVHATGPSERLNTSWDQTRGLFWLIFFALTFSILPLGLVAAIPKVAASVVLYGAAFIRPDIAGGGMPALFLPLMQVGDVLSDLVEPFQIALAAAVASWVFMWRQENPIEALAVTQPPYEI